MDTTPSNAPADSATKSTRRLLFGWGNSPGSSADVFEPDDETAARRIITLGAPSMLPRGLGRSYGDAALNGGGSVIDMRGVAGLESLDENPGSITAEGGTSFDTMLQHLVPKGYFLPVTPGTRFVTLGGAIAADVHGKNHHVDGSIQRHVEQFDLLQADGRTITVRQGTDLETFAATAGGLGLTGIVTRATLRLVPIETAYMHVTRERTPNLAATLDRFRADDDEYRYSVAWVDCLARGRALGRSVLMRANHARVDQLPDRLRDRPLAYTAGRPVTWPRWTPSQMVSSATVKLFNEMFYRAAPASERERIEAVIPYFYPLDRVREWNRAYGSRGFIQYQFVVPDGAEETLETAVATLAEHGCPSLFAVLKRMGPGAGMLSFPIGGWTLALDIPARAEGLADLLDELDEAVAAAGGRVYLAKDARMRPEMVAAMYPELERWRTIRQRLDPNGRWQSDLARRLELV